MAFDTSKKWSTLSDSEKKKAKDKYGSKQGWQDAKARAQGFKDEAEKKAEKAKPSPAPSPAPSPTPSASPKPSPTPRYLQISTINFDKNQGKKWSELSEKQQNKYGGDKDAYKAERKEYNKYQESVAEDPQDTRAAEKGKIVTIGDRDYNVKGGKQKGTFDAGDRKALRNEGYTNKDICRAPAGDICRAPAWTNSWS